MLVTFFYVSLSKRIAQKNILFSVVVGFFTLNIILFWVLFKIGLVSWLAYLFYIWVAAYSITGVTQCWTLANDIFNPREAKRLFGFIVSGGSLGGIVGGLVTNQFAERIGTENLLLFAAVLLGLCIVLINEIWKTERIQPKVVKKIERSVPVAHLGRKPTWNGPVKYPKKYTQGCVALLTAMIKRKLNDTAAARILREQGFGRVNQKSMWNWRCGGSKPEARYVYAMQQVFGIDPVLWFIVADPSKVNVEEILKEAGVANPYVDRSNEEMTS